MKKSTANQLTKSIDALEKYANATVKPKPEFLARKYKKALVETVAVLRKAVDGLDVLGLSPAGPARGRAMAKVSNALELQADLVERFTLKAPPVKPKKAGPAVCMVCGNKLVPNGKTSAFTKSTGMGLCSKPACRQTLAECGIT